MTKSKEEKNNRGGLKFSWAYRQVQGKQAGSPHTAIYPFLSILQLWHRGEWHVRAVRGDWAKTSYTLLRNMNMFISALSQNWSAPWLSRLRDDWPCWLSQTGFCLQQPTGGRVKAQFKSQQYHACLYGIWSKIISSLTIFFHQPFLEQQGRAQRGVAGAGHSKS